MAEGVSTLPAGLPDRTLGWGVIRHCSNYLRQPNGPRAGLRWEPTHSQALFLLWWYAVDPDGRWLFHHGVRRHPKGAGKSPFAAVHALAELTGPVRLADFDPSVDGGCVGKPVDMPLVQIAATAESQTANTMRMVRAMATKQSRIVRDHHIDVGKTVFYTASGGQLEVITSSASAAEGAEVTFAIEDEALALDTPIPTPTGWTTVGELRVGDQIFGSNGAVTVTHLTSVFTGRPCYRVTFRDGSDLVADEGHLWMTRVAGSAALPKVRRTGEMLKDGRRFAVPLTAPFDAPPADLPVDPYLLGYWLGDGASRWAGLTVGAEDLDFVLSEAINRGVPAARVVKSGTGRAFTVSLQGNANGDRYTKDGSSFRGGLVALGVLGNKHVPTALLRGSLQQRLAVLRGLMDSDGHIGSNSASAVFVNSNKRLVDDVVELLRGLGYVARVNSRRDDRWISSPICYKVSFRPDADRNPFLMPRKASRVRARSRRQWKSITAIEPVESVPVKCIEVDSADHLFVAGSGWNLTHNTEHWVAATGGPALAATLDRNLAKSSSRAIETANAWEPGIGSVAEATFDAWQAQQEGRTRGESRILYDARIAPADTDLADEESLDRALRFVYDDCFWVDLRTIKERIWDPRTAPDVSRRFYLNQPTATVDAWVTPMQWAALEAAPGLDDDGEPTAKREVADGEDVVLFFDGSKSRDATSLAGCCMSDGHVFAVASWEPKNAKDPDELIPVTEVDAAVARAFDRWNVLAFFADVKEWEGFTKVTWPAEYGDRLLVHAVPGGKDPQPIAWDMRSHGYDFTMACELTEAEIRERSFTHDGDPVLARHVGNARRRLGKYGVSIGKESKDSPRKIDLAVCMVGARMVRRTVLASKEWQRRQRRAVGSGRIVLLAD